MAMKLIQTEILEASVRMLYADAPSKEQAKNWIEIQVEKTRDECQHLAEVHREVLGDARALFVAEGDRLKALAGQSH